MKVHYMNARELLVVVSHQVDAENWTQVLCKSRKYYNHWVTSLAPGLILKMSFLCCHSPLLKGLVLENTGMDIWFLSLSCPLRICFLTDVSLGILDIVKSWTHLPCSLRSLYGLVIIKFNGSAKFFFFFSQPLWKAEHVCGQALRVISSKLSVLDIFRFITSFVYCVIQSNWGTSKTALSRHQSWECSYTKELIRFLTSRS